MTIPVPATDVQQSPLTLDHEQFSRVFREVLPGLSRYARSLARNSDLAEDLVQDAAFRAWRSRDRFVIGTSFKAWLYRILRNGFLSHVRHGRVAKTDTYGDDFPDVAVASGQEAAIFLQDVRRYWTGLSVTQRRAIQLVGVDGRSYEEAAAIENVSTGTLKSRVSRGRNALLALLDGDTPPARAPTTTNPQSSDQPIAEPAPPRVAVDSSDRDQIEMLRSWRLQRIDSHSKAA